jgi:AraC-like DNA-binding protein
MGIWFAAGAGVVLAMAVVITALVIRQSRQQRQMIALLDRLAGIEMRWAPSIPAPAQPIPAGEAAEVGTVADSTFTPSGDVLAGMTSHVNRIVESGGGIAQSLADQAIFCVHRNIEENVAPAAIAEELFVSLRTLERGLSVALDCTPSQLILAMKMREARRLLEVGEGRVADVAERLGFANAFHFSRRFKSFYRVSPSELRRVASSR